MFRPGALCVLLTSHRISILHTLGSGWTMSTFPPPYVPDHVKNIHERFLRHIWSRQYLDESILRTADGRALKILEVGSLNLDGGADFAGAKIKIGGTTYTGDIEIHRNIADWFAHHHQDDPRYNRVILHVVLERSPALMDTTSLSGRKIPVLILSDFLSESIQSIWQKAILDERARRSETIRCFPQNNRVDDMVLRGWLGKLAIERLELKIRRFEERLRDLVYEELMTVRELPRMYGEPPVEGYPEEIPPPVAELTQKDFSRKGLWEQVLYEGLMEGLGYSKNRDPFLRLARSVSLKLLRERRLADDGQKRLAVLFAVAGLLPTIKSVNERDSKTYVRDLVRNWNAVRPSLLVPKLQAADWQFFPTRPGNFPPLRISAANVLIGRILNEELFRSIIQTLKSAEESAEARVQLTNLLSVGVDQFWQRHYGFDRPANRTMVALGLSRINDLMVNTVVPMALLYARIFKDTQVRERTLRFYQSFPSLEENTVTRVIQRQLLRNRVRLDSADKQQGAIQLYRFYCTEDRCTDCEIGKTVFHSN